ncbi:unnamed protein product [Orchesella dallaii]|uniref:Uncharacterized protein n=1 Tax=Orchesella dallaii TaxID=48710 RepID=A0ABP1QJ67_9HEXA
MAKLLNIIAVLASIIAVVSAQTPAVTFCPLYLAIQNRCPTTTPSTTVASAAATTTRPSVGSSNNSTNGNGTTESSDSEVVTDPCGLPTIIFCPAMEVFLNGGRQCNNGQTVQVSLTTLGQLLVNPNGENAQATAGSGNVEALGNALSSVSKTIQDSLRPATVGVTFIPVGQLIG